jgi:mevalonate kinase
LHWFVPHPPGLPDIEELPGFPLHLVFGAVPRSGDTGTLVGGLRKRVESGDSAAVGMLDRLGKLAGEAIRLFRDGSELRPQRLGALAREAQEGLKALDLSTPGLDDILEDGRRFGALGGKLSGAGGGGAFYLVCETPDAALDVKAKVGRMMKENPAYDGGFLQVVDWPGKGIASE